MADKHNNQRIFAYLRKSTKKKWQRDSIDKQEWYIKAICKRASLDFSKVEFFIDEWYSGYKWADYRNTQSQKLVRKRKKFQEMLNEARKSKFPCKILAWNVSRFARNVKEWWEIANLLWDNLERDIKVEGVYFLDGKKWSVGTSEASIIADIRVAQQYSEDLSIWAIQRKINSLSNWFLGEIRPPKWLIKDSETKKLIENEAMIFIRKAFEMKGDLLPNTEIHNYLKRNWVTVYKDKMYESIFSNTVYIWYYTDKTTWELFNLKYVGWKPPISMVIYNKAHNNVNKMSWTYWENQKWDLLVNLLKTSNWRSFTGYGKIYKLYNNTTEKIHISQKNIFNEFWDILKKIYYTYYKIYSSIEKTSNIFYFEDGRVEEVFPELKLMTFEEFCKPNNLSDFIDNIKVSQLLKDKWIENIFTDDSIKKLAKISNINEDEVFEKLNFSLLEARLLDENRIKDISNDEIKKIIFHNWNNELKKNQLDVENNIKELLEKKEKLEVKIKSVKINAILNWFTKEDVEEATQDIIKSINDIDEEIINAQKNNISDKDLDKFIEALQNIFEHISNMLHKGITGVSDEDMLHFIKLTTFELIKSPSKGLEIKLFEGLKKVFYDIGTPKVLVRENF